MPQVELKHQDWSEIDKIMESFGEILLSKPDDNASLKTHLMGENTMTDAQHKMIIALFTNELEWGAHAAFKFTLRICPMIKERMNLQSVVETDLRDMYKVIKKDEASKLINILKAIARRKK